MRKSSCAAPMFSRATGIGPKKRRAFCKMAGFTPAIKAQRTGAATGASVGRLKNLIILNSGHNIAPEPIEEKIAARLSQAQHVVIVGNGRGYLCALVYRLRRIVRPCRPLSMR